MLDDMQRLREQVQTKLTPARSRHSIAVQRRAMQLAGQHGADWYRAGVAGLVHDICHDMAPGALLNYLRACGILLDILTLEHPQVWHAVAGAQYAREVLGIEDAEILSAVRYHTTARREMTALEKVVYVADLTSEDREFPDVEYLRWLAGTSLDAALAYSLRYTMNKLVQAGKPVVRDTWEAYNFYVLSKSRPIDGQQLERNGLTL